MNKPITDLQERITALNVASGFLIPNITPGSLEAVTNWLKADLAALEQLRAQMKQDDRRMHTGLPSHFALEAIIEAKRSALHRLIKIPRNGESGANGGRTPAGS